MLSNRWYMQLQQSLPLTVSALRNDIASSCRRQRILTSHRPVGPSRTMVILPTTNISKLSSSLSTNCNQICCSTGNVCHNRSMKLQRKHCHNRSLILQNESTMGAPLIIRWHSTTSTTASTIAPPVSASDDSNSNQSNGKIGTANQPDPIVDTTNAATATITTKHDEKEELQNTADTTSSSNTATAASMREKIRDRISETRTAAVAQMKEFADHPAQSAAEGAKSFSGMLRKYGPVFIGTYGCVYFTTLGLLFSGVQSGVLDPMVLFSYLDSSHHPSEHDTETATTVHLVYDFMMNHTFTRPYAPIIEKHPAFANFAVAWIAVKFTEPIRLPIALGLTPRVAQFLGYTGGAVETSTTTTATEAEVEVKEDIAANENKK